MSRSFLLIVPPSLLMASLLSLPAMASPMKSDWGRVSMEGSISDTACAINPGSLEQTIDMAILPISQLVQNGVGKEHPFEIHLLDCTIAHADSSKSNLQHFTVSFDGAADGNNYAVFGEAEGIAMQIIDDKGNASSPGVPSPEINIIPVDMKLNYALRLVGNGKMLRAGTYHSSVRFTLDYY
ncbi:exported minor pilin protein [Yersinia rohdei]|uniref:Exported minor pilin protein n=2 Tax=Yersinia rohdei TaxID=29485 RepID=A0A0U1HT65_YERRO|nr:pilin [Yersinia rohdei]CNF03150.1 exported minor pilin protein [Yersinia rohdei]CNJ13890.1 exported minor pilin protein [Yersinia rohdei]CQI90418.1 exported minor pilin protein [Yersinia rohdei]CQJ50918.1 exported minor pilin protein [Yersinia rohdei]